MNRLDSRERAQIIRALVEGNSIRSTVRMTGFAKNTITKLLVDLGDACAAYQDLTLRDLPCQALQLDEIWSFVYAKAKNVPEDRKEQFGMGDVWTWTAIDAQTKLIASWMVADRTAESARLFLDDLRERIVGRVQITTDGFSAYVNAVEDAFGTDADYAQLIKQYGSPESQDASPTARRYSPQECTGTEITIRSGDPNPGQISTSYVERQNLTMRMGMRRFTRLTNGFSKKVENLAAAVALHFMYYNFARPHKSLGKLTTPAMAAGLTDHVWTCEEIAALLD
jgi:IS1 family transposase